MVPVKQLPELATGFISPPQRCGKLRRKPRIAVFFQRNVAGGRDPAHDRRTQNANGDALQQHAVEFCSRRRDNNCVRRRRQRPKVLGQFHAVMQRVPAEGRLAGRQAPGVADAGCTLDGNWMAIQNQ